MEDVEEYFDIESFCTSCKRPNALESQAHEGFDVCRYCGASSGRLMFTEPVLPHDPNADAGDIAARQALVNWSADAKDDVYSVFQDEETKQINDRIIDGYNAMAPFIQNFPPSTKDTLKSIWKAFIRNQASLMKYRRRDLYFEALVYVGHVIQRDVAGMASCSTMKFREALTHMIQNDAVSKFYKHPSDDELCKMYLDTWIPAITPNANGQDFIRTQFQEIRKNYSAEHKELRNVVAGVLWYSLTWLFTFMNPAKLEVLEISRITQSKFTKITGCKASSISNVTYELIDLFRKRS